MFASIFFWFLVPCYATLRPSLFVCPLVSPSRFFLVFLWSLPFLLLPKCSSDLKHSPHACDWSSRVFGLVSVVVDFAGIHQLKINHRAYSSIRTDRQMNRQADRDKGRHRHKDRHAGRPIQLNGHTVEPRSTGPTTNEIPPIVDVNS